MKKLLLLPLLVVSLNSLAGWEMMFCDSADEKGNCVGKSETFVLSGAELTLKVVLANAAGIQTTKVYFEIYSVNTATFAEDLVKIEELTTAESATTVVSAIKLSKKGTYLIKARDSYKDYITSRELMVK